MVFYYSFLLILFLILFLAAGGIYKFLILGFMLYLFIIIYQKYNLKKLFILLGCFFIAVVFFVKQVEYRKINQTLVINNVPMYIIDIDISERSVRYVVQYNLQKLIITQSETSAKYQVGDKISVSGSFNQIGGGLNRYLFNNRNYNLSKNQTHQTFNATIFLLPDKSIYQFILQIRNIINRRILEYDEIIQPFLYGFVLGDTGELKIYQEVFVAFGIMHAMALSTEHLYLFTKFSRKFFNIFKFHRELVDVINWLIMLLIIIIVGDSISLIRAFLQIILMQLVRDFFNKEPDIQDKFKINLLIMLLLLFWNPYVIFNIGFQYSFLCFFIIISSQQMLEKLPHYWQKSTVIGCICYLATLPIILTTTRKIYLFSIFIGIVAILFVTPLFIMSWLTFMNKLVVAITYNIYSSIQQLLIFCSDKIICYEVIWLFPHQTLIVGISSIFCIIAIQELDKRKIIVWLLLISSFIFAANFANQQVNSINFISLPNGETTIIRDNGFTYMIDCGGNLNPHSNRYTVEQIVLPSLNIIGVSYLDYLIITHDDIDHIGSVEELLKIVQVKNIIINQQTDALSLQKQIFQLNLSTTIIVVEDMLEINSFTIYNPIIYSDKNNNTSLVVHSVLGGQKWLFMGDLEAEGEKALLAKYSGIEADFVKLGHHGSRTSSTLTFLKSVKAQKAIISVQENNRFNHPHKETLANLEQLSISYWVTNIDGSQHFFYWQSFYVFLH